MKIRDPLTKGDLLRLLKGLPLSAHIFVEAVARSNNKRLLYREVAIERKADPDGWGVLGSLEGVLVCDDEVPGFPPHALLLQRSDYNPPLRRKNLARAKQRLEAK